MAIVLSLLTAVFFGAGDFAGGLATRRTRVVEVVAGAHLVGLVGVGLAAPLMAEAFTLRDLGLGAVAGVFGGVGLVFLYRRLAIGPMSVVAPLTAVTSAVVPVVADVARGSDFSITTWVGIVVGLTAIAVISGSDADGPQPITPSVVSESLLAGIGFGGFFVVVDLAESATAPWPIVGARLVTVGVLGLVVLTRPDRIATRSGATVALIAVAGALDTLSNTLFLYASNVGDLAVVSVLSSLYPLSTVLIAWIVLRERLTGWQAIGVTAAVAATLLIASG